MSLSTRSLIAELRGRLTRDATIAARAAQDAKDAAQHSATAQEKREDARTLIEFGNFSYAQAKRVEQARSSIQALDAFADGGLPTFGPNSPIGLGAIVDAQSEDDDGVYSRTFVMLPVGAGEELSGPGGDGIIVVVTPNSPVGKALLGKRRGDVAEVTVRGEPIDWEILEVGC